MPGDKKHHTAEFRSCVEQVMAKGQDESSAYAICTTTFQEKDKPIFEAAEEHAAAEEHEESPTEQDPAKELRDHAESRQLHLLGATGGVRIEKLDGREHIVVPVVALMEGVIHAVNAETPEFVPAATLQRAAATWNGKPVVLGHPVRNGKQCSANAPDVLASHGMGVIRNSRCEGTKLLQEAWIDKQKIQTLHPKMHDRLLASEQEEVSVGAFVVTDGISGTHNGKQYKARWQETLGDHLAFLPGGRGACSIEMGCGAHRAATMRVCEDHLELESGEEHLRDAEGKRNSAADLQLIQDMHDRAVELGASCTAQNVRFMESGKYQDCAACDGSGSKDGNPCEVCDGKGKIAKMKAAQANEEPVADKTAEELDRLLMEKAAAGDAAFKAACSCEERDMNTPEQKAEIIRMLVADKHSGFTAGDEKMLEAASDERLESFRVAAEARATREKELKAAAEKKFTTEEFMEVAPPELKSLITRQQERETATKAALVSQLKAAQSEYSETELSVMPLDQLTRLASVAKVDVPVVDYGGRGVPRALQSEKEDFTPPNPYDAPLKTLRERQVTVTH